MVEEYKYIFIVLVYKNIDVLDGFYESISNIDSHKVIILDSYYSDEVRAKCRAIAASHESVFLEIPNIGYGAGNNAGIKYAREHYKYDFLIVSNSDIIVKQFDAVENFKGKECIIAPETVMLTGKCQNPSQINIPFLYNTYYYLTKWGYSKDIRFFITLSHALTRSMKILFYLYCGLFRVRTAKIFAAHGSFFIMTAKAVEKLYPVFCDEMFLYNEETYLAFKSKTFGVPIYYCKDLMVNHLEGASCTGDHWKQWSYYKESATIFVREKEKGFK